MGPAVCLGLGAITMKEDLVQGALSTYTHNFIHILYPTQRRRVRIALYSRLFARSIVNRRRGVGYKIPPWGKGLIFPTLLGRRQQHKLIIRGEKVNC